ncbi:hypothetical protein B0H14DRAFT_3095035 [Mycena olivaceomarginata]|nr:hypothetical protein B0H14DRAFT_3095035 [Mycena olivaceomarginata]
MGSRGLRSTMLSIPTPASPTKKSKSTLKPDVPAAPRFPHLTTGRQNCEDFLDEVLRHDGRGDYIDQGVCAGPGCEATEILYRCTDCMHGCLYCGSCVKRLHASMPFHQIERWENGWFRRCTLKSLGVRIQLGHRVGEVCPNPSTAAGDNFVVITTQGIKELLRMRLYPATGTNPRSAATFTSLRRFAHMTLESKCSPYEFYHSLVREIDTTGLELSPDRYSEFLRMTRQWQHLLLLKRAGRGHDACEDHINATKPGEVTLLCPACPHPGINLPPDWPTAPAHHRFLYALFLAIDANFRLMHKDVSSEEKDPGLVRGWGFFGDVTKYMVHLEKHWDQKQEPLREFLGTASSDIGTVDCARHNMKCPNGVGDLQMGERYLNMDYLFFMSLTSCILLQLFRMHIFDPHTQLKGGKTSVGFLVPKFHLPAHIESCNLLFSFNLTPFVGRTDGEAPERGWADANRLVNSTSVSGPGAWQDTLEVHFQYWNWKKIM